jgi:DNA-binding GntR family transcriptional regulator
MSPPPAGKRDGGVTARPARKPTRQAARAAGSTSSVRTRGSTADTVTDSLREAILDGLIPPSAWLREEDLAAQLQVSRTPVRVAIGRLVSEGLAIGEPNQGARVAPMTLEDILAVSEVREHLEGLAARLVARRATTETIARLEDIHLDFVDAAETNDGARAAKVNLEFHRAIREAANNQYLDRFLTLVEHGVRRVSIRALDIPYRTVGPVDEHRAILDAVISRQEDLAEAAARNHVRMAREARLKAFLQMNT